jgi:hypothetical protein
MMCNKYTPRNCYNAGYHFDFNIPCRVRALENRFNVDDSNKHTQSSRRKDNLKPSFRCPDSARFSMLVN